MLVVGAVFVAARGKNARRSIKTRVEHIWHAILRACRLLTMLLARARLPDGRGPYGAVTTARCAKPCLNLFKKFQLEEAPRESRKLCWLSRRFRTSPDPTIRAECFHRSVKLIGPKLIGPKLIGPKLIGPKLIGPKLIGPKLIGPKVIGPKTCIPSVLRPPRRVGR
jgi:hypothetical protein